MIFTSMTPQAEKELVMMAHSPSAQSGCRNFKHIGLDVCIGAALFLSFTAHENSFDDHVFSGHARRTS